MIFCTYILYIWLNYYENLKIKKNKTRIFTFSNLQKIKGAVLDMFSSPFTQISLIITGNQIQSTHIIYNHYLI